MRQLVSQIDVGDREIRVSGPHSGLAEGVLDSGSDPAAGVPSFCTGLVGEAGLEPAKA
jgi:hypothetical protein